MISPTRFATSITTRDRLSEWEYLTIWLVVLLLTISVVFTGNIFVLSVHYFILTVLIVYTYLLWRNHPDFVIGQEDFYQVFYTARDAPHGKQSPTIHKLAEVLFVLMGLQKEAGIISPEFKYDNKPVLFMLSECALLCLLLAKINADSAISLANISINMQGVTGFQMWVFSVYTALSVFGLFFVLGFITIWISHQLSVIDAYRAWQRGEREGHYP